MLTVLMLLSLQVTQAPAVTETAQPPRILNPQKIIGPGDYPTQSLRRSEYGIVSVLLHVSETGKVESCDATERSKFVALDRATCSLFKSRARFDPAKNAKGLRISGDYRTSTAWGTGDHFPRTTIDLSLQVAKIPSDYKSPARTHIVSDASGRIAECEITESSGSNAADQAVCAYLKQQEFALDAPKSGSSDVPSAAVRSVIAQLSTQPLEEPKK